MSLGSTQPLVKMSTRNSPGGKGGRCVRLTTYHHTVSLSRNLGALTLLDPSGPAWPVTGVLYLYLTLSLGVTPYNLLKRYRHFDGSCYLHLPVREITREANDQQIGRSNTAANTTHDEVIFRYSYLHLSS